MKKFIITLLSALTLTLSGLALAGGMVVEAPVDENPAVQVAPPVEEEVVEAAECDATKADCDTEETADAPVKQEPAEETADAPVKQEAAEEVAAS